MPVSSSGRTQGEQREVRHPVKTAVVGGLLCLALGCTGETGAAASDATRGSAPHDKALQAAQKLRATRMGVTRQGELWAWDQRAGTIQVLSLDGRLRTGPTVSVADAIDVDSEWGVVALVHEGAAVQIFPIDGPRGNAIRLENPGQGVAWMGPNAVAVSPSLSAGRVETWDLAARSRSAVWGEEQPVPDGPGVARLRVVDLQYDHAARLLYSLDTFSGDLQVFDPGGQVVRRAGVTHPRQAELEAWFKQRDAEVRASGARERTGHRQWDGFAVAPDGTVWMVEYCRNGEKRVTMRRLPEQGPPSAAFLENVDCCSYRFTLWAGSLVMYRDPYAPILTCNFVVRRFP